MPKSTNPVRKANIPFDKLPDKNKTRQLIHEEEDAVNSYETMAVATDDPKAKEVYQDIADEEKVHAAELNTLLDTQDPDAKEKKDEGEAEAEDMVGKTATDMTSDEAWIDFKAGYKDFDAPMPKSMAKSRDGPTTTLDAKLDTIATAMNEVQTDVSRLTDVVPQVVGDMNAADNTAAAQQEQDAENGLGPDAGIVPPAPEPDFGGSADEGDTVGTEDDANGLAADDDELTPEDAQPDESSADDGGTPAEQPDGAEQEGALQGDEPAGQDDEEQVVSDGNGEMPVEDDADSDSGEEGAQADSETADEEEDDDDDEDDTQKMLAKAVVKLTAIVKMQGRQIAALQKSMNVQATVRKSVPEPRPIPTVRKTIGVVARPPMAVEYTANRWGGADPQYDDVSKIVSKPAVGHSTPAQILEYCDQVAKRY